MKITKLVIDRERWGAGRDGGLLRDPNTGLMCCLGFVCLQLGYTEDDIDALGMPDTLVGIEKKDPDHIFVMEGEVDSTLLARNAASINDNTAISAEERESDLTQLFAGVGIELEFVN